MERNEPLDKVRFVCRSVCLSVCQSACFLFFELCVQDIVMQTIFFMKGSVCLTRAKCFPK